MNSVRERKFFKADKKFFLAKIQVKAKKVIIFMILIINFVLVFPHSKFFFSPLVSFV